MPSNMYQNQIICLRSQYAQTSLLHSPHSLMLLLSVLPFPQLLHCFQASHPLIQLPVAFTFTHTWEPDSPTAPNTSMTCLSFQITNKPCSCEVLIHLNPNVNNAPPFNAFYSFSQRPYVYIYVFALAYAGSLAAFVKFCVFLDITS